MLTDSLKKRFAFKLSSNFLSFIISFILAGLVPRALGVVNYGNYNFLISGITQILLFVELRTSYAFFTKLSQRPKENYLQVFYSYLIVVILCVFICVIFTISFTSLKNVIFLNQTLRNIFLASGIIFIIWMNSLLGQMMDAYGKTIWMEKVQIFFKVLSSSLLLLLAFTKFLNLDNYFAFQYITQGLLFLIFISYLRKNHEFAIFIKIPRTIFNGFIKEFYQYCAPLFFYILVGLVYQFSDRWILQYYGGSYQQGLYSFSFALSNICILITTAMLPLLQREVSIHAYTNNVEGMAVQFKNLVPLIYAITAFLSAFVFIQADLIVSYFGGIKYEEATTILRIGSLYPLIYAYGNLHSTFFYATSRTKTYLILAIITTPISIFGSYIVMSHDNYLGLNMGGKGLALKEMILGVLSCIVYLVINLNYLHIKKWKFFAHFIFVPVVFILLGYTTRLSVDTIISTKSIIMHLFLVGAFYTIISIGSVWLLPALLGFDRNRFNNYYNMAFLFFKTPMRKE